MNDIIKGVGEVTVSLIMIIIPMLFVMGFYENWCGFIKMILAMLSVGDFCVIGTIVHNLQDYK